MYMWKDLWIAVPLKGLRVPSGPVKLDMCSSMLILKTAIIDANFELLVVLRAPRGRKVLMKVPLKAQDAKDGENL